jgi:DNA invertase Pin-like site-specific DNA recombinase
MKAAIYARVSTFDQEPENQLAELRRYADYADARGGTATAYVDKGVSGAKDKRPALDQLVADARRRRFDVLVVWRLDRLGRNLRHLILLLDELNAVGVAFVSLGEGSTPRRLPAGCSCTSSARIAEFERARIQERVRAGLARVRAQGRTLGRPRMRVAPDRLKEVAGLSVREAALALGLSRSTAQRRMRAGRA